MGSILSSSKPRHAPIDDDISSEGAQAGVAEVVGVVAESDAEGNAASPPPPPSSSSKRRASVVDSKDRSGGTCESKEDDR